MVNWPRGLQDLGEVDGHTVNETTREVIEVRGEKILHDLDGMLMGAYNIYDVGRVLPHPYNAVGDLGSSYLHDFRAFAFSLEQYIKMVRAEYEEED